MAFAARLSLDGASMPLGMVCDRSDLAELLRHAADYLDDNPDACEPLFMRAAGASVPPHVGQPFFDGLGGVKP